jgi:hypothetical protein
MVVYLAVPTTGLGKTVAADLATVLQFAAGPGQTRGSGVGQLPAGYLPLTSQYGLAALSAYTATAAEAVATQSGKVPPLIPTKPVTTTTVPTGRTVPTVTTTTLAPSNTSTTTVVSSTGTTVPSSRSKGGSSDSAGSRSSGAAPAPAGPIAAFDAVDARLWLEGFPVVVPVAFAVLGALAVPTVFRRGRRLGRW